MAGMYNDDESTDDEYGMNYLAERLSINKGENSNFVEDNFENSKDFKQYCNMRRKKFAQEGQSSSSSSIEVPNDNPTSSLACPDIYHNKKRQNGDKNTEQLANPKRTCLSDRFHRTPDWKELKKKPIRNHHDSERPLFPESLYLQSRTSPDLFPDKKDGKQINSMADEDDSDFEIPTKINRRAKLDCGESSKSNNHSSPTSKQVQNFETKPSTSYLKKLFDSSSEDESKLVLQNGALKGGRQDSSADHNYYSKKLFTRKLNKKLLDSDESEEDSTTAYRSRPLVFSSSDSEDFRQSSTKTEHTATSSNGFIDHSCFYGDGFDKNIGHHSRQRKLFRSNQKFSKKTFCSPSNRVDGAEGCDRQFLSTDFQRKNVPHRNCRFRRSPRMNMTSSLSSNVFTNSNSISGPVRGRRITGSERGGRRSGSPHPRSNRYQHEEDSKCRGRSVSASRAQKEIPSYAARYPDVFDAEESENEYFTANSYSDTEASTESLGGLTINTTFPHNSRSISCTLNCKDRSIFDDGGSTDDEISVVFSSGPYGRNNESNRGTGRTEDEISIGFSADSFGRNNETSRSTGRADEEISVVFSTTANGRNNESRRGVSRTLGRRHNRGTHRQLQNARELVSLSPDPVEQVRQMEEDERMARMLQAQFDAEIDPDYTPVNHSVLDHDDSDDDEDDDDDIIDPVGDSDSDESAGPVMNPFPRIPVSRRGFGISRFTSRSDSPLALFLNATPRIDSRNRRRSHFPPPRHLTRIHNILGFGLDLFGEEDDYETLLSLDLDSEIYPRGLHSSDINRLPTRKYTHPNSSSACGSNSEVTHKRTELNKECQVCLTDYENGDVLRILPCFHEFHTPCIDPWLLINHTCPVCRVTVDLDA